MNPEEQYIEVNKESWNNRVDTHFDSEFYDVEGFLKGNTSLNSIELALLRDITGKKVLHLQCHFGQDSISLSRMGAEVTGIDLSDKAIEKAKELALQAGTDTKFVCSDVYNLPNVLNEKFDIVFTSYGTIGWLPDLDKWAAVINHFLKPGGQFIFAEFHPVVWMFDDDFKSIGYNYFKSDAIVETNTGTYAEKEADMVLHTVSWNHGLSEVFTSLINQKMQITAFNEFDYSPYNCFRHTEEFEPKKFRIKHLGNNIPMVYSLLAQKAE
ncbi:class I SAM-dependent methyltransferase [Elizabethkingia bruuniana]|uniref:class I SAM-dependent methyltransferase n=1 Tax=Elizabethkingia bruuniana TaxID=1756149 RepID=UPI00241C7C6F|nr:class I SAM-dependent methyltransferase [Elizabethkingia bruuniana]